jgi:adenylate cyclase
VDQIAHQPELLKLGGETRPATILFSDIRGFTGIAERFGDDAAGLTNLVNRLLTPLSEEFLLRKGTIDKYIGDAIMAFWNAPMEDPVHAENACEAALAMVRALDALNRELAAEAGDGGTPLVLRTGIGINTGRCLAGNLGSRMRFNYSVLGDAVNIAARLEALTRTYDVDIIIGETTAAAVRGRYAVVELDEVQLKGRQEPAKVFALLGDGALAADTTFLSFAAAHQRLRDGLVAGRDQAARSLLDELGPAAEAYGLGAVYAMYAHRLSHVTPRLAAPGSEFGASRINGPARAPRRV